MQQLIDFLNQLSQTVPIPLYTLLGGFIEEIIAPLPSPIIMTTAGSFALQQDKTFMFLVLISLLAAVGKTAGSQIIYVASDKAEDVLLSRFGKFLGINHKDIEKIGKLFNKSWKDDLIVIFLRAFPIFPGAPVSAVCGAIKLNTISFLRATFIGTFLRSLFFGAIGYYGLENSDRLHNAIEVLEDVGLILFAVAMVGLFLLLRNKDRFNELILQKLHSSKSSE